MHFRMFDKKCNKKTWIEILCKLSFQSIFLLSVTDFWKRGDREIAPELQSWSDQDTSMFDQAYLATNYANRDLKDCVLQGHCLSAGRRWNSPCNVWRALTVSRPPDRWFAPWCRSRYHDISSKSAADMYRLHEIYIDYLSTALYRYYIDNRSYRPSPSLLQ